MTVLIIILTMLAFNAVFAAYEMALAAVSANRLNALVKLNKQGAKDALFMKERVEASLAVIQLGITLVGAVAAATGGAGADEVFSPYLQETFGISAGASEFIALLLVVVPLSAFTIIFGELVPKTFALNNKEWVCLQLSPAMRILSAIFRPAVVFLESIVKIISNAGSRRIKASSQTQETHIHELKAAASMARTSKLISPREEKIVHSATELSERFVRNIMIPADKISMIPLNLSLSDALVRAHMDMHTRFPVCETDQNPQTIIGYVNFKDIVFALHQNPVDPSLKGITRPLKTVGIDSKVSVVLEQMIQDSVHIALVKDTKQKVCGLLTLEDLLEELVGEIQDEYDKLPAFIHPYLDGWVVGGGVSMAQVASAAGIPVSFAVGSSGQTLCLAEWFASKKPGSFKTGDAIETDGLAVTVRKLRRKQLSEALILKK
jgi:putative hemolysin